MSSSTNPPTTMNISSQVIAGTCNFKCAFSFNYPVSTCTATNGGNYISLSCPDSTSPVTFNNTKYQLTGCYIYSPSLHLYNNVQANAEIIIMHSPTGGGQNLLVCIPVSINGTSGTASTTLGQIITTMATGAPSQGESISQGINDFTLNEFIPMQEYYNYTSNSQDFVAFGLQGAIYISQANLTSLQQIISPVTTVIFPSASELFINYDGPTKGNGVSSDDIYIDCQPTNISEEETNEVVGTKAATNFDAGTSMRNFFNNPYVLLLLGALIFVVLIIAIQKGLTVLTGGGGSGDGSGSSFGNGFGFMR
jgi:carbonic anhydrase